MSNSFLHLLTANVCLNISIMTLDQLLLLLKQLIVRLSIFLLWFTNVLLYLVEFFIIFTISIDRFDFIVCLCEISLESLVGLFSIFEHNQSFFDLLFCLTNPFKSVAFVHLVPHVVDLFFVLPLLLKYLIDLIIEYFKLTFLIKDMFYCEIKRMFLLLLLLNDCMQFWF